MAKISKKILSEYKKGRLDHVLDFSELKATKEKIKKIGTRAKELEVGFSDPSHNMYLLVQNLLSFFSEEISVLDEFTEYYDLIVEQDEVYMPSYPPTSPVTGSYYTFWCFCDFSFGKHKETITTIFYDLVSVNKFDDLLIKAVENLNASCMRFYKHLGFENDLIILEDIMTNEKYSCLSTSEYIGVKEEIWFVRMVPNLDDQYNYQLVLTTPYVIRNSEKDWLEFFARQGINKEETGYETKYQAFMKHHPNDKYWHDYIMDGYTNYEHNCIYLTGIPDIKGSKPHELGFK